MCFKSRVVRYYGANQRLVQGKGRTGPCITRLIPESDHCLISGLCKCLLFMYVRAGVGGGAGDQSGPGILTGVITNCTVSPMAAAKVEENFMIQD